MNRWNQFYHSNTYTCKLKKLIHNNIKMITFFFNSVLREKVKGCMEKIDFFLENTHWIGWLICYDCAFKGKCYHQYSKVKISTFKQKTINFINHVFSIIFWRRLAKLVFRHHKLRNQENFIFLATKLNFVTSFH